MFDHEKLNVYQRALDFIEWSPVLIGGLPRYLAAVQHLDEAAGSIVLNIAEGNGRFTSKDRCKYFDIARGSALECSGCLDILYRKKKLSCDEATFGKKILAEIVAMLFGLIKSNSDRAHEPEVEYGSSL